MAVDLISELKKFVPAIIKNSPLRKPEGEHESCTFVIRELTLENIVWGTSWTFLLGSMGRQSLNASREVRHSALSHLQRILLGPQISTGVDQDIDFPRLYNQVVFPLLDDLLKPEVVQRDPHGMPDTKLRAATLLCKSFLHFSTTRTSEVDEDVGQVWLTILDFLDRFMNDSGRRDQLVCLLPFGHIIITSHGATV